MRDGPQAALLICDDCDHAVTLVRWLTDEGIKAHAVPGLCRLPEKIRGTLAGNSTGHLVLALCPEEYSLAEVQTEARKAGLDPLGVEIVHLQGIRLEKAKMLLAAALARARAYTGSQPENAKPCLASKHSRRSLFKFSLFEYRAVPSVQESLCIADSGCKVCAQVCSRNALEWSDGRIQHDKTKCGCCGLCITACPSGAIFNPAITPAQLEAEIATLLDPSIGNIEARGILFHCGRVSEPRTSCHEAWMPVELPCLGMAPPTWFLAPLIMGASAVGIVSCSEGCPIDQKQAVEAKVAYCGKFLRAIGASAEMISLSPTLAEAPEGDAKRTTVKDPFGYNSAANVLATLAREYNAPPGVAFEHPHSPLGIIEVREDLCTGCGMCASACPTGALCFEQTEDSVFLTFEAALCSACEQCRSKCPEVKHGTINLSRMTDLAQVERGITPIYRDKRARCTACGAPTEPSRMMKRVQTLLGSEYPVAMSEMTQYCRDCRSTLAFRSLQKPATMPTEEAQQTVPSEPNSTDVGAFT